MKVKGAWCRTSSGEPRVVVNGSGEAWTSTYFGNEELQRPAISQDPNGKMEADSGATIWRFGREGWRGNFDTGGRSYIGLEGSIRDKDGGYSVSTTDSEPMSGGRRTRPHGAGALMRRARWLAKGKRKG